MTIARLCIQILLLGNVVNSSCVEIVASLILNASRMSEEEAPTFSCYQFVELAKLCLSSLPFLWIWWEWLTRGDKIADVSIRACSFYERFTCPVNSGCILYLASPCWRFIGNCNLVNVATEVVAGKWLKKFSRPISLRLAWDWWKSSSRILPLMPDILMVGPKTNLNAIDWMSFSTIPKTNPAEETPWWDVASCSVESLDLDLQLLAEKIVHGLLSRVSLEDMKVSEPSWTILSNTSVDLKSWIHQGEESSLGLPPATSFHAVKEGFHKNLHRQLAATTWNTVLGLFKQREPLNARNYFG